MIESRIIALLNSLNENEIKSFQKFIQSPYFNQNQTLIKLSNYLAKHHNDYTSKNLGEQKVFKFLFPTKKFDKKYLNVLLGLLTNECHRFLAFQEFESNDVRFKTFQLKVANDKDQPKLFLKIERQLLKSNDNLIGETHYLNQLQIKQSKTDYAVANEGRNFYEYLTNSIYGLEAYYTFTKLKLLVEEHAQKSVFGIKGENWIEEYKPNVTLNKLLKDEPAILIYWQLYQLIIHPEREENFELLFTTVSEHGLVLEKADLLDVYIYSTNYAVRKINKGEKEYELKLLELYQYALKMELLLNNGMLHQLNYKNIVSAGLRNNEIEWTEQFIIEYKSKLKKEVRKNAFNYNLANLHFYKSEYGKAQTKLLNIEFTDVYYAMDYRALLLKIYFEQTAFDALDNLLSAFAVFVRRNKKASVNMKRLYLNLIKFTKQLSNTSPRDKKRLQLIKERIANTPQVGDRNWLNQKIDEFLT